MWNKEKTKKLIQEITQKYGEEIAIDGSKSVLGLEKHLDRMVAKLMGLDLEIVQIARQWRAIIKRAAITEGLDKVSNMLEQDELIEIAQSIEVPEVEEIVMEENIVLQEPQSILNTYNIETIPEVELEILSASNLHMETTKVMEDIRATEDIKNTDSDNNRNKEVLENIKDLDSESYKDIILEESI